MLMPLSIEVPWRGKTIRITHLKLNLKTIATSLTALTVFLAFSPAVLADQFDDQIAALKQQAAAQQAAADQYSAQAQNYQQEVNQLQAQINELQTQINLSQAEYNQVTTNIQQNQAELDAQKVVLGANIKEMYLQSSVTPLEMLASSSNISQFLNEQQYQDKIKDKIQNAMAQIETLQASLEGQQLQLTHIIENQHGQQVQLSNTESQMNSLLATAQQNAAAANAQVQQSNSQIATLRAQQAAAIAAASHHVTFAGASSGAGGACDIGQGNGGYPTVWCNAAQDSMVDSWGMYNRECVSYAAWAATDRGHYVPYGLGNANQWPGNASAEGIPVDHTPQVGNVAIYMGGPYGHAMIVEAIQGSNVVVSSMNADDHGHFEYDSWPISELEFIHFH
jgi:peptidoglycan hydrolase CwlO-like protein